VLRGLLFFFYLIRRRPRKSPLFPYPTLFRSNNFKVNKPPAPLHIPTRFHGDTAGFVSIEKNRHIHHMLSMQQKKNMMKRRYDAFAHGKFAEQKFVITEPIGRKDTSIIEREVRPDGQFAETEVKVLQEFDGFTHVELSLNTGRTHQIRVHLSYIGNPLLGDDLYGGERSGISRQALHCKSLELIHPVSGEPIYFTSPLKEDMEELIYAKR